MPERGAQLMSIVISFFFTVHMLTCLSLSHGLAFLPRIRNLAQSFSLQQFGISVPREKKQAIPELTPDGL